jgi:hypothetical protein
MAYGFKLRPGVRYAQSLLHKMQIMPNGVKFTVAPNMYVNAFWYWVDIYFTCFEISVIMLGC